MRLRRRRYHTGGGIPPHKHPHDVLGSTDDTSEDSNILGSLITDPLVSESTQPYGYTAPLDPFAPQITVIPEKELTFEEELAAQDKRAQKIQELQLLEYIQAIIEGKQESYMQSPELINLINEEKAYRKKKDEEYDDQHGVIDQRLNYPSINPDIKWMFPPGMSMDDINKYVAENPLSNPVSILLGGSMLGAGVPAASSIIIPGTSHIAGGVAVGDVMNAYFLKEGLEGLVQDVPAFIDDPSLGGAGDIAIDALLAYPGMKGLKTNVLDPFTKAFKEAKVAGDAVGMKNAVDDLGYNYSVWSDDAGKFVKAGVDTPVKATDPILQELALSDKTIPTLGESRIAPLVGSGLLNQPKATQALSDRLVESGLYSSTDEASAAIQEIRNPSMNTVLPTSGKTIGQIMKDTESSLLDYYTNPLAKDRLTELYGGVRGSSNIIPGSMSGLSRYHADPADLLKYQQNYGLTGTEILDEIYNKTGMLPRYYASTDKIKKTPSFGDVAKGMDLGVYDEPFDDFYYRRLMEKAKTNPDKDGALIDAAAAKIIKENLKNAAGAAGPDPITGVQKIGMARSGLNAVGALETFGLSELAKMITEGTKVPISYAENYLADVIYHELNHVIWGQEELPIELIDGWTPYMTQDATEQMYKGGSQVDMLKPNPLTGRPDPKKVFQYKSQPEEIQARMGQTRRHLEVSLGYTKDEIENIALAAREEGGEAMLGKQGSMSFFGADDGAGGKYIHPNLVKIENKLKELGVVNENRSLQQVLDDLTEAAQRSDETWYDKVIGGKNEEQKAQSLMGLLWRVPVYIGVAGAADAMTEEQEDLPVLGYAKGGILQAMTKKNRPDKNEFVSKKVRILRREGKGLRQAVAIALDMYEKKKQEKKFQEGGLFEKLKDRREKIKTAKEYYKEEGENPTMYLNEEGKIIMPGVGYDTGEPVYYEEELTPRQYKRFNRTQFRDYKRDLRKADREDRQQERQERRDERIKERGYRRVGRADILPFDTEDILDYLAGDSPAGYAVFPGMGNRLTGGKRYRDKLGNVTLDQFSDNTGSLSSVEKGADDSVLDHELVHKSQYGPLQLLASYFGLPGAGRIQDKTTRKAFKNLMKSIRKNDTVLDEKGTFQGNYMAGDKSSDVEFDAILKSGLSSASLAGYDLEGKSFDEIVSILAKAEEDKNISTNMGHLSRFMTGTNWNDEQKGFIMDAIKANLGREAFTAEDARKDLR